jgi:hypothetical protein
MRAGCRKIGTPPPADDPVPIRAAMGELHGARISISMTRTVDAAPQGSHARGRGQQGDSMGVPWAGALPRVMTHHLPPHDQG